MQKTSTLSSAETEKISETYLLILSSLTACCVKITNHLHGAETFLGS